MTWGVGVVTGGGFWSADDLFIWVRVTRKFIKLILVSHMLFSVYVMPIKTQETYCCLPREPKIEHCFS